MADNKQLQQRYAVGWARLCPFFKEGIASSAHVMRPFKDLRRPPAAAADAWEKHTQKGGESFHT